MKEKLKKIVACSLLGTMLFVGVVPYNVYAEDTNLTDVQGEVINESTEEKLFEEEQIDEQREANPVQEKASEEEIHVKNETEQKLEYLYIESPYLEAPDEQNIVVSWKAGEVFDKVQLLYVHNGTEGYFDLEDKGEGLYLYQKQYTESEKGVYRITDVLITSGEKVSKYNLAEAKIEAVFSVNEYYPGYKAAEIQNVAVVSAEDVHNLEAVNIIEETLENTAAELEVNRQVAMFSMDNGSEVVSERKGNEGKIVVALDPGHDAVHAGASGNGVREEVATLKIAEYCKAELERYSNVEVYMCRDSAACPYPDTIGIKKGNLEDIKKRVQASAEKNADVYVSIHLNSATPAAKGAEVWYPSNGNMPNTSESGGNIAQKVQNELAAIGLSNRGTKSSEEYTCMIEGEKYGLPAIIVEHAFLTNANDANTYLKTEAGLQRLGIADATGIAKYFKLGFGKSGWETDENGNKYFYQDGNKSYGEQYIGGKWYHFDENTGAMTTGWHQYYTKRVYYSENGTLVFGEKFIDGAWYYFSERDGGMVTGWHQFPKKKVYYSETGALVFGEYAVDGKWYYFSERDGGMVTGWHQFPEKKVYYSETGELVFGEYPIGGKWYYFSERDGGMVTGWHQFPTKKVYYSTNGTMVFGERLIAEKWYYLSEKDGGMVTGWHHFPNKTVYYASEGEMVFGERYIDGNWYYLSERDGRMVTGWCQFPDKKVYYTPDGIMVFGEYLIGGNWYCFSEKNGGMITGWHQLASKKVYYNEKGIIVTGEKYIDGNWYYFSLKDAAMLTNTWHGNYFYDTNGVRHGNGQLTKIEGKPGVTQQQMINFYKNTVFVDYPGKELAEGGAPTIEELVKIFYEEAEREGIKPEIAWAQAMLETGYLKFGGQVKVTQFNFAGLGALDGGAFGADFSVYGKEGVRMGVRAQIQHLKAYANSKITAGGLQADCVDPRFAYVEPKGNAPYVEYLGIKENPLGKGWATSEKYGFKIMKVIEVIKKM